VTLKCDLELSPLTSELVRKFHVARKSSLSILDFLELFVRMLWQGRNRQTDGRTDGRQLQCARFPAMYGVPHKNTAAAGRWRKVERGKIHPEPRDVFWGARHSLRTILA